MKRFGIEMTTEQTRELIKTIQYRLDNDNMNFESGAYLQRIQEKIFLAMKDQAKKDGAKTLELE